MYVTGNVCKAYRKILSLEIFCWTIYEVRFAWYSVDIHCLTCLYVLYMIWESLSNIQVFSRPRITYYAWCRRIVFTTKPMHHDAFHNLLQSGIIIQIRKVSRKLILKPKNNMCTRKTSFGAQEPKRVPNKVENNH